jgi:glucose dehydrogenase
MTIRICAPLVLLLLAAGCRGGEEAPPRYLHEGEVAGAASGITLVSPLPNGEWRLPAGDLANTRYTPLAQIDTGNVANLKVVTTMSTGINRGHEGNPLVVGATMYVVTPFPNLLYAVDLSQPGGALRWTYDPHAVTRAVGIGCCEIVNRCASFADGKII